MNDINQTTGKRIRMLRKACGLSLDDLSALIHKSKSSLSKYEQGSVKIDLDTLDAIACALKVSLHMLVRQAPSEQYARPEAPVTLLQTAGSAAAAADIAQFYLYFFGGAKNKLRTCLIELDRHNGDTLLYTDPVIKSDGSIGCSFFYSGITKNFDAHYRMTFRNQYNENDIFCIQVADALSGGSTMVGLVVYFAAGPFQSFATKCLLSKNKLPEDENLAAVLRISPDMLREIKKRNALYSTGVPQEYDNLTAQKK